MQPCPDAVSLTDQHVHCLERAEFLMAWSWDAAGDLALTPGIHEKHFSRPVAPSACSCSPWPRRGQSHVCGTWWWWGHSLAGTQTFSGGMLRDSCSEKAQPQPHLFTPENHFRRLHISVLTQGLFGKWLFMTHSWHPAMPQKTPCDTRYWCDLKQVLGCPVEGRRAGLQGGVFCSPGGKRGPLSPSTDSLFPFQHPSTSGHEAAWWWIPGAPDRLFLDQRKPDAHQIEGNFTSATCSFSVGNYESLTETLRISTFVWKLFGKSWRNNIIVSMYPKLWQDKTLAKFLIFRGVSSTWSY